MTPDLVSVPSGEQTTTDYVPPSVLQSMDSLSLSLTSIALTKIAPGEEEGKEHWDGGHDETMDMKVHKIWDLKCRDGWG